MCDRKELWALRKANAAQASKLIAWAAKIEELSLALKMRDDEIDSMSSTIGDLRTELSDTRTRAGWREDYFTEKGKRAEAELQRDRALAKHERERDLCSALGDEVGRLVKENNELQQKAAGFEHACDQRDKAQEKANEWAERCAQLEKDLERSNEALAANRVAVDVLTGVSAPERKRAFKICSAFDNNQRMIFFETVCPSIIPRHFGQVRGIDGFEGRYALTVSRLVDFDEVLEWMRSLEIIGVCE